MSTDHLIFEKQICAPPDVIFELIADMPNYGRWLPGSASFGGTTEVTPYPVRLGTTYLDSGPLGARPGTVTEYQAFERIAFHHTMQLKKGPLNADMDFYIRYTLVPAPNGTTVTRTLDLTINAAGLTKLMKPFIVRSTRRENARTMSALKRYAEAHPRKVTP